MVTMNVLNDRITENLAIAGITLPSYTVATHGKKPGEVFDAMIEIGIDWEMDLSEATDEEWLEWTQAELIGRLVRAKNMGKTILLDGVPVAPGDEAIDLVVDYAEQYGVLPEVIQDNALTLILGSSEDEESPSPDTGEY